MVKCPVRLPDELVSDERDCVYWTNPQLLPMDWKLNICSKCEFKIPALEEFKRILGGCGKLPLPSEGCRGWERLRRRRE